jgi:hypothetical protein
MFNKLAKHLSAKDIASFRYSEWMTLGVACGVAFVLWYAVGRIVGLPGAGGHATLLLRDAPGAGIFVVAIAWPVIALVATLLAGTVRGDAGVFAASIGLLYLPTHGGDARDALLAANGTPSVYLTMAVEVLLLGAIAVLIVEGISRFLRRSTSTQTARGVAPPPPHSAAHEYLADHPEPDTLADRLTAVFGQALATLIFTMFLVQTPLKGQAIVGAGVAAMLAAMLSHYLYGVRGAAPYVAGTIIAAVAGYLYNYYNPAALAIGDAKGILAGPARVLPLHYATLGVAGAIFGYWSSTVWKVQAKQKNEHSVPAERTSAAR